MVIEFLQPWPVPLALNMVQCYRCSDLTLEVPTHINVTRKTYKSTYGKRQKNRDVSSVLKTDTGDQYQCCSNWFEIRSSQLQLPMVKTSLQLHRLLDCNDHDYW